MRPDLYGVGITACFAARFFALLDRDASVLGVLHELMLGNPQQSATDGMTIGRSYNVVSKIFPLKSLDALHLLSMPLIDLLA
ncbi:hypothetical protein SBC1_47450 (plasmid) [Caballeronia sp. SBC1]|nr:hypothetical protein SBC2_40520 [Caballeronia sp. SBC2]QIN64705.1 hypothetical protein SBC1_47450 [Caballeronia sp. SBC1]